MLWGYVANEIYASTCRRPMSTKLGKVLTYCEGLSPLTSHDIWSRDQCYGTWQFGKYISPLPQDLQPVTLAGYWLRGVGPACKRLSHHQLLVLFLYSKSGWTGKDCFYLFFYCCSWCMSTILDLLTIYGKQPCLWLVMSHGPLNTWLHKVTGEMKMIKSSTSQCLWWPNLSGWQYTTRSSYPSSHIIFWSRDLVRSMTNWIRSISVCRTPMSTKEIKVVTYRELLRSLKWHDLQFITWKIEKIVSTFSQDLWLWQSASERKNLSRHQPKSITSFCTYALSTWKHLLWQ